MSTILSIGKVVVTVAMSLPPQWTIKAEGTVATGGWQNPRLEARVYTEFPKDRIQDFDFVADPPDGPSTQAITPIAATHNWTPLPKGVKGVRIHASGNSVVARPTGPKP